MKEGEVIIRYARGLFKAASGAGQVRRVLEELSAFAEVLKTRRDVFVWLCGEGISAARRISVMRNVLSGAKFHEITINFVSLLIKRERIFIIEETCVSFGMLCDEAEGVERGVLTAAEQRFADGIKDKLERALSLSRGKKVILSTKGDPSLIGGLNVRINDRLYDTSIKRRLFDLKEELCK
jgi:F-type H+-transporting ATPase subunit delta